MILNTNIPEKILKEAGLNKQQYLEPKINQNNVASNKESHSRGR
jgi:hypothetical protein